LVEFKGVPVKPMVCQLCEKPFTPAETIAMLQRFVKLGGLKAKM
jgi:hypothetical protein